MMKKIITLLIGVTAFALFPLSIYAADYPSFGPQGLDEYLWYGDATYPFADRQGIDIEVDETSVSFQSVIANVFLDAGLIEERNIVEFLITANNKVVDSFTPYWDQTTQSYKLSYRLRITLADWNTGSNVYFKVVGVSSNTPITIGEPYLPFVVAWSTQTTTYELKPLPVIDRDAIDVLNAILAKLENLKAMTESKLSQVDDSIKKIYEIPPETQAKFDAALAGLQAKLPTEQIKEQANAAQQVVENSANRINNTPQKVKFGEINWMGVVTTPVLDFTDFMDSIEKMRKILQIALWCEFFYFVILILRPRLTV